MKRFDILMIRIKNHGEALYDYNSDKDKELTRQLKKKMKDFTGSIVLKRVDKSPTDTTESYFVPVTFAGRQD